MSDIIQWDDRYQMYEHYSMRNSTTKSSWLSMLMVHVAKSQETCLYIELLSLNVNVLIISSLTNHKPSLVTTKSGLT